MNGALNLFLIVFWFGLGWFFLRRGWRLRNCIMSRLFLIAGGLSIGLAISYLLEGLLM